MYKYYTVSKTNYVYFFFPMFFSFLDSKGRDDMYKGKKYKKRAAKTEQFHIDEAAINKNP